MSIFYTSDLHFSHKRVLEYEPQRKLLFGDIKNHDEQLIARWNYVVKPEDVIWVLGDPFISGTTYAQEIMNRLNGRKKLIIGNHDYQRSQSKWERMGFEIAIHSARVMVDGKLVWLSHYPYKVPWYKRLTWKYYDKRYDEMKLKDDGGWLFHGHIHSKGERIRGRQINVGVDVNDFYPVNEVDLIKIIRKS